MGSAVSGLKLIVVVINHMYLRPDAMKIWLIITIIFINFHLGYGKSVLPGPVGAILETAWNELNPNSMKNRIKDISRDLSEIKTHLDKIEQAVIFGRDVKKIEYL